MTRTFQIIVTVADSWMDDGFNLTTDNLEDIFNEGLRTALPYAYEGETNVEVSAMKKRPAIAKATT